MRSLVDRIWKLGRKQGFDMGNGDGSEAEEDQGGFPRQHGTLIVAKEHVPINLEQIYRHAKLLYPDVVLGNWDGTIYNNENVRDGNLNVLRFGDAERAAILPVPTPPNRSSLDLPPVPNLVWPNAAEELREGKAHIMVMATDKVSNLAEAIRRQRALTLLTSVVASLVPTIGIISHDGPNALPPDFYVPVAKQAHAQPLAGVPIWVRVTGGALPTSEGTKDALFTLGLRSFGMPELFYVDLRPGLEPIIKHAYWLAQNLMNSGIPLETGARIRAYEGLPAATVEYLPSPLKTASDVYRIAWDRSH